MKMSALERQHAEIRRLTTENKRLTLDNMRLDGANTDLMNDNDQLRALLEDYDMLKEGIERIVKKLIERAIR